MLIHHKVALKYHFTSNKHPFLLRHLAADQVFSQGAYAHISLGIGILLDRIVKHGAPEPFCRHIRKVGAYRIYLSGLLLSSRACPSMTVPWE